MSVWISVASSAGGGVVGDGIDGGVGDADVEDDASGGVPLVPERSSGVSLVEQPAIPRAKSTINTRNSFTSSVYHKFVSTSAEPGDSVTAIESVEASDGVC